MSEPVDLEQLIATATPEEDHVPGAGASVPAAPADEGDWSAITERLVRFAETQSSASAKSRALCAAAMLQVRQDQETDALWQLERAVETSPRLGLAAKLLDHLQRDESPEVERLLDASARASRSTSTRNSLRASLYRRLDRVDRQDELIGFLDRLARSGEAPAALSIERVVRRLAAGQSLAGVELAPHVAEDLSACIELLTDSPRDTPLDGSPLARELALARAARQVRQRQLAEALPRLKSACPGAAWLAPLESSIALLSRQNEDTNAEDADSNEEQDLGPRRRLIRSLDRGDAEALRPTHQASLSRPEHTSPSEHAFLCAWLGEDHRLERSAARELAVSSPSLAVALHELRAPALLDEQSSATARWLQLGAMIGGFDGGVGEENSARSLEASGEAEELRVAEAFIDSARNGSTEAMLAAAAALRPVLGLGAIRPVEALAGLRSENLERTRQALDEALQGDASLTLAARHAANHEVAEAPSDGLPEEAALRWMVRLEQASRASDANHALSAFLEQSLLEQNLSPQLAPWLSWMWWAARLLTNDPSDAAPLGDALRSRLPPFLEDVLTGEAALEASANARDWRTAHSGPPPAWASAWLPGAGDWLLPPSEGTPHTHLGMTWPRHVRLLTELFQGGGLEGLRQSELCHHDRAELDPVSKRCLAEIDAWAAGREDEQAQRRAESYWNDVAEKAAADDDASGSALRLFAFERLAELDERRRAGESSALWRRTLAEEFPHHLPSLLRLEEALISTGDGSAKGDRILPALAGKDRSDAALVLGARALSKSDFRQVDRTLRPLLDQPTCPLFALRALESVAREQQDDELLERCLTGIATHAKTDLDRASVFGELTLVRWRLGRTSDAQQSLQLAIAARNDAFVWQQLECVAQPAKTPEERAEQVQGLAELARHPAHALELWRDVVQLWTQAEDEERTIQALERVLAWAPDDEEAFETLLNLLDGRHAWEPLRKLIEARLERIPERGRRRLRLELKLADVHSQEGTLDAAKIHLERALALAPKDIQALKKHAEVSAALGAHESAERSLVGLRNGLEDPEQRLDVVRSLANVYFEHLGQLEKAMDAFQEILEAAPQDLDARTRLVEVYSRLRLTERATALQTALIQEARSPDEKRRGALQLARIYEEVGGDLKRAAATLERTRKAWPLDAEALEATILFMDRHQSGAPRGFLLDRAAKDARRQLEGGRVDQALLDTLGRVARLSGVPDQAAACFAARSAYLGEEGEALEAGGLPALSETLEEHLAPAGLAAPLRILLRKTGPAMDAAFSVDLGALQARPLAQGAAFERVKSMTEALGWSGVEIFVSDQLGARCLPVQSTPPRFLIGSALEQLPEGGRDYLLLRGLKLQAMGAGALARSRDEDRWPLLAALLHLFSPNWRPPEVDARKVAKARALLEHGLARSGYDDDVPMLALEAIGAIGGQVAGLGDAPRILANRAGLVGVGQLSAVFDAIAAGEGKPVARSGPSRFRWIESHPEARDLLLFMTSRRFTEARVQLGLAEARARGANTLDTKATGTGGLPRAPQPPPRLRERSDDEAD